MLKTLKTKNRLELVWPIDLFRQLIGVLSFFYFLLLLSEVSLYSTTEGLLDHSLSLSIYPFTIQPLFAENMPVWLVKAIYLFAIFLSLLIASGIRSVIVPVLLYFISVCALRWNFLIINIEDGFMNLFLFWLMILPNGNSFSIKSIVAGKIGWQKRMPDGILKLFFVNISLIYFVAGITKWTSAMWLDGTAIPAILKLPFTRLDLFDNASQLFFFKLVAWMVLIIEPLLALMPWLRTGSGFKKILGIGAFTIHLFNIIVLGLSFSNFACIIVLIPIFKNELQQMVQRYNRVNEEQRSLATTFVPLGHKEYFALIIVVFLTGATASPLFKGSKWRLPAFEKEVAYEVHTNSETVVAIQDFCIKGLWLCGLAQSYELVNWIDDRNFSVVIEVETGKGVNTIKIHDLENTIPTTIRSSLFYSYLVGVTWNDISVDRLEDLKSSLSKKLAVYLSEHEPELSKKDFRLFYSLYRINPRDSEVFIPIISKKLLIDFQQ